MIKERSNPLFHENVFRPVLELNSATWNAGGAGLTLASAVSYAGSGHLGLVGFSVATFLAYQGYIDCVTGIPLVKRQCKLFFNNITFEDIKRLRKDNGCAKYFNSDIEDTRDSNRIYIGEGFEWGVEHANRAHQVLGLSTTKEEIKLPLVLRPFISKWEKQTQRLGGLPWIAGIGDEVRQYCSPETFYGHTMINGNVGTGKTTLFILLSLAMIHKGYTVIILDPKNDASWRKAIKREMDELGIGDKFYYFNPAQPTTSCRLDPVRNWNRSQEIAERISSIMINDGKADSFTDFNWTVINKTVNAMLFVGIRPQVKSIARYVNFEKERLALKCLQRHYQNVFGDNWHSDLEKDLKEFGSHPLQQLIGHYQTLLSVTNPQDDVEGIISLITHNAEHMQKMTTRVAPTFSVLTSKPLDELISPEENLEEDAPPIVDTIDLVEGGGVLYMALDSLSDAKSAGYLSKLTLADIAAVAGERYNASEGKGRRVAVFVDEVHAALAGNEALLNLLAQGRAAAMQLFIATQTKPDLEAKTDKATAERVLGLCNNFFSLRVNDSSTQEYAAQQFGEVPITSQQITVAQSSGNTDDITDFGSGYSERMTKTMDKAFGETLLGSLPKLQYVARLADGRKIKGRIPIVKY